MQVGRENNAYFCNNAGKPSTACADNKKAVEAGIANTLMVRILLLLEDLITVEQIITVYYEPNHVHIVTYMDHYDLKQDPC